MFGNYNCFYTQSPYFRGLKCNWTNKYNHKYNINVLKYFVENPLKAMTALSLELMDITRYWDSSFVMLCQAFTSTGFSCFFVCGSFCLNFVFSKWNACSIRLKSGDWLGHCRIIHVFTFKNSKVAFAICFGSLSTCIMKHHPLNFAAFDWIWPDSILWIIPLLSFVQQPKTKITFSLTPKKVHIPAYIQKWLISHKTHKCKY